LPVYVELLARAQTHVLEPTTPAQTCRWYDELRAVLDPALAAALPLAAGIATGLSVEQLAHIERKYVKVNAKFEDEYLQDTTEDRQKASHKRAVERAEMLYGDLDSRQRQFLAAGMAASPFDAGLWFVERKAVQRDTLQTLHRLTATPAADRRAATAALQSLAQRTLRPPQPYRDYQQRLIEYNCALAADLHNITTPAQRQAARARLKGWEDDLRTLIAQSARASG
jgi:hypothetical protein